MEEAARKAAGELPGGERIEVLPGDITDRRLGLSGDDYERLTAETKAVFHLAAIYNLAVPLDIAQKVNVEGTGNIVEFCERCQRLERHNYVSTAYVAGTRKGVVYEHELIMGQWFKNHYESTKFQAEVWVRESMDKVPTAIYRPAIVVGDSRTGATQKYDGPYFVIQWLLRQPGVALLPTVGDPRSAVLNVVPRDFVVDAIAHLSGRAESRGVTFQLADPAPLTVDQMIDTIAHATQRHVVRLPLPLGVAKWFIDRVPGVYKLMRIPSSAVDYFVHPTRYDTTHAREQLAGTGIGVPPFPSYADKLVQFVRAHPEVSSKAMV